MQWASTAARPLRAHLSIPSFGTAASRKHNYSLGKRIPSCSRKTRVVRLPSGNGLDDSDAQDLSMDSSQSAESAITSVVDTSAADEDSEKATDSDDDELEPLMEALERAKEKVSKASFRRQALEAEAQQVGEISMEAKDVFQRANDELNEALKALEGKQELHDTLEDTLKRIADEKKHVESLIKQIAEGSMEEMEEAAFSLETMAPMDVGSEAELDADEDEFKSTSELKVELQQLDNVSCAATVELSVLSEEISRLKNRISILDARAGFAESDAEDAEARVAAVMKAAADAVTAEVEAQAVMKETEFAIGKATSDIEALSPSEDVSQDEGDREDTLVHDVEQELESAGSVIESETLASEIEPALLTQPQDEQEEDIQTSRLKEFMEKYGKVVAGAALAVALGILLVKTDTGQSLLAQVSDLAKSGWAAIQRVFTSITPDADGVKNGLLETIWLLAASIVIVPLVVRGIPGGTPVLGFLAAGALIGPHALGIVKDVEGVRHLAEMGVVFLLFNIGLELSLERLRSMARLVFGLGNAQVLVSTAAVAVVASVLLGISGPGSIILGSSLALSSTAVALQVLQDRGESGTRHGRATFSILLLQDLAVVVVLMLIPLLAPKQGSTSGGLKPILSALGVAGVKAAVCMTGIIVSGRVLLRPLYRFFAGFENEEIFAGLTLLIVLGTSELTRSAGLSLALGAFLAGLLMAETEYALQVESDIAPYKGLLMGLFFMTVGMEISVALLIAKCKPILIGMTALLVSKVAVLAAVGPLFGLSQLTSVRSGLLLAAGGEFAFVAFGEAVAQGVLPANLVNEMYLMVALSMALIPYMAIAGAKLGQIFGKSDIKGLQPTDKETGDLKDHIIIAGYGRVGRLIAQLLSKRMIPFVALDVRSEIVQIGKSEDMPVYFGDAGSNKVLHYVGAEKAACVVVVLDSPGANYRCVWSMKRHFPNVKIYVRAYDMDHARSLEKAGATVVIPETLEPSLQLAASVLSEVADHIRMRTWFSVLPEPIVISGMCETQMKTPSDEIANIIENFRVDHLAELSQLSQEKGFSLGYGYDQIVFSAVGNGGNQEAPIDGIETAPNAQSTPLPEAA